MQNYSQYHSSKVQTNHRAYEGLHMTLQKETPILTAQIRALYRELDKKFHLRGANIPITFGFESDSLGSYNQTGHGQKEHFHFSLLFIGYAVKNPLSKEEREDLYKHEYAHYMQYNMTIPRQYQWQPGIHGSAWKYCCSLVGAQHRREQEYKRTQNVIVKYETGEKIKHPKFGEGIIEKIEKQTGSVTLHIRFGDAVKVIDQKWLLQTKYKKGRIQKP